MSDGYTMEELMVLVENMITDDDDIYGDCYDTALVVNAVGFEVCKMIQEDMSRYNLYQLGQAVNLMDELGIGDSQFDL